MIPPAVLALARPSVLIIVAEMFAVNAKGYRPLDPRVRANQGDAKG